MIDLFPSEFSLSFSDSSDDGRFPPFPLSRLNSNWVPTLDELCWISGLPFSTFFTLLSNHLDSLRSHATQMLWVDLVILTFSTLALSVKKTSIFRTSKRRGNEKD